MRISLISKLFRAAAGTIGLLSLLPLTAQTMVPWLTRSADNARSGWNPNETVLTQASVASKGLVRSTIIPLIGDARGMEAQPLILPQVTTPLGVRDVMVLPSMANFVRGVDAHDGSSIWQVQLGTPITGTTAIDAWAINQFWGCISTGVIDPQLKRLYQVCWVVPNAQGNPMPAAPANSDPTKARYYMFVLNVGDGSLVVPPIMIQGTSEGQDFNVIPRKQRSSLVETNVNGVKTVFGCSGTFAETAKGAAGYCFAFDVASNSQSAIFATTAGEGAGIWMAGQGAAADAQGNLYVITGNGDFDGSTQWGESFLKLKYTPPAAQAKASIAVVDHWTPWTDQARTGGATAPPRKARRGECADRSNEPAGRRRHEYEPQECHGENLHKFDGQAPCPRLSGHGPGRLGRRRLGLCRPSLHLRHWSMCCQRQGRDCISCEDREYGRNDCH